jgi:hypothetical protein
MGQVLPSGRTIGCCRTDVYYPRDEMNAVMLEGFFTRIDARDNNDEAIHTPGPTDRRRMDYTRRRHVGSGRLSTPLMNAVVHIRRQNPPEHL